MASSTPKRRNLIKYSEDKMRAACQAVVEQKTGLREAARLHGVPPSTLRDRLKGRKCQSEIERTVITAKDEERLVKWIQESARRGFSRTSNQVQRAVQMILDERGAVTMFKDNFPGKKWVALFCRRHPDVTLKTPRKPAALRAVIAEGKLKAWFEAAFQEIQAAGDVLCHPSRIFHCDGIGFQLGGGGFSKIMANKTDKRLKQVSMDTQTQITVLACASASGEVQTPLITFPGQRFAYNPLEGFPEAHFAKSSNGCINGDIFTSWIQTAFIPATDHLPKPLIIFADRHMTHLTLTVSELCRDHGIILYQLPSQPLDLTTFKLLKEVWREEVFKFHEENCDTLGKKQFSGVLKKAWERGIQKDVLISGFRAAGLYPWNPDNRDMTKSGTSQLYLTATTETATVTETSLSIPGKTEPETLTEPETTDETTLTFKVPNALEHEEMPVDPPSPSTHTSPLLPLSSSPIEPSFISHVSSSAVTTLTPTSSSLLTSVASVTVTNVARSSPSSSHVRIGNVTGASSCMTPIASSSILSSIDRMPTNEALDRLLDLTAKAGLDGLVHYRTLHSLGLETNDPEERLFSLLYSRLTRLPQTDNSQRVVERTFDNSPLPSGWTQKRGKMIIKLQPSKTVITDAFRQHVTAMGAKKKVKEDKEKKNERKEIRKRKREEKTKTRKEDGEK